VSPLFFITRLEPTDDALASRASALGFTVLRVPLIATELGMDSPVIAHRLASGGDGIAIAWTSRRAAEALARVLPGSRAEMARIPMYCLGEESAGPVRRAGFEPQIPERSTGATGLAQYILDRAERDHVRRVVFLRGDRSLPDLPNVLRGGGLEVLPLEVYRTRFVDADVSGLLTWLEEGRPVAAAFYSPSGVLALERLLDHETRNILRDRVVAIARGDTTARALRDRGYGTVFHPSTVDGFERVAREALESVGEARR
jgi:uroporphyrinogen-III synthase